jgi:hypothetical protein
MRPCPQQQHRTCPWCPAVPLSTSGVPDATHSRFTWRRASRLSSPFRTMSLPRKKSRPKRASLTLACGGWGRLVLGGSVGGGCRVALPLVLLQKGFCHMNQAAVT